MKQNLIILAGIPGSGKSTMAEMFFTSVYANNHQRVSSDEIREREFGSLSAAHDPETKKANNKKVFGIFHDKIDHYLAEQWNVIADATFLTRPSRDKVRQIGERHGADVHLILFKNIVQAISRNALRDEDVRVPEDAMEFMVSKHYDTLTQLAQENYASVTKIESFT